MPLFYSVVSGAFGHSELTRTKEVIILFVLLSVVTLSKIASLHSCIFIAALAHTHRTAP